ncbi:MULTISPECIES: flagellar hook-basal body complex protein [unclassified Bradyrhizobium]|uniref:flagellar hook-basal body complex protein n=1 Tax=unclassified Bradyrhizobium TaxID=2631580 RepID=UPI001FF9B346|nr:MULTISPECIES: flagellar hook-basal body complex protein [unclassified Bradyrhizobium]MCK1271924.1 flagellar hook-basal body complex protein [Bradyrhizobium sp. 84]MCK1369966.1 flagellar hook-basal body complex protein [Bradyrhizobium sp. 49]MCK1429655.1 flagellar hook-basal body complex protein [Bradyrhizobium sp. 87]MCK1614225.1 flagellar hook-basal body complex protein [Bradyrhizobium sp. 163]MCK1764722.1 flagellar hook-basal body complex protein [Bradyrhizobium sp. 136]
MGIFDAMNTSVGGLQAQSYALQNISGNIANSSTTAYKGIGTSFVDLIPDSSVPSKQVAGGVTANAKATITTQGTISGSSVATNMAITGDGFFSIQKATGVVDNAPVFSGVTYYTRRGDFQLNANGNLVNGAGYYLMGVTVDPKTGNPQGNVATVLKFQNNFIPAQATTSIQYAANLPTQPNTVASTTAATKTLLAAGGLNPSDFAANPLPVGTPPPPYANATTSGAAATGNVRSPYSSTTATGTTALQNNSAAVASTTTSLNSAAGTHLASSILAQLTGQTLVVNGHNIVFDNSLTSTPDGLGGTAIGLGSGTTTTVASIISAIQLAGGAGVTASLSPSGNIVISSGTGTDVAVGSGQVATALGISSVTRGGNVLSSPAISGATVLSGAAAAGGAEVLTSGFSAGDIITVNGQSLTFMASGATGPNQINVTDNITMLLGKIDTLSGATGSSVSSGGVITLNTGTASNLSVASSNSAAFAALGFTSTITKNRDGGGVAGTGGVIGNDIATFTKESISGGAVTAYNAAGTPVNLQLRWAKTDSASLGAGHADTWNMFYQTDPNATGTTVGWVNTGQAFTFAADGSLTSPSGSGITINNVSVSGQSLGSVSFNISSGGLTQYASTSGAVTINTITQNGYAAGQLRSVAVNNNGLVVGTFSNGQNLDLAQVSLSHFNGTNYLKAQDGGAYAATEQSGPAIDGASGSISGSSLEGSNTDIADEFTKLIVTQQAYSANTKVITTANTMVQDLLNVLR